MTGLIGFSGFVGTNLRNSVVFDDLYNSKTVGEVADKPHDMIVCAAAPATMWAANNDPAADLANIDRLIAALRGVKTDQFVLISTIAVLDDAAAGYDEDSARYETAKAYGANRRHLELAVEQMFADHLVVRLPALFGAGLKKNFLFDMLNPVPAFLNTARFDQVAGAIGADEAAILRDVYAFNDKLGMWEVSRTLLAERDPDGVLLHALEAIGATALGFTNPASQYQYYDLTCLWDDIHTCLNHDLRKVHMAPQPLAAGDIYTALTGKTLGAGGPPVPYLEDMHTRHSGIWDAPAGYSAGSAKVLGQLQQFFAQATP